MGHLPTKPVLPLKGAPYTMADILIERVNFEDRLMERERAHDNPIPPSKRMELPRFKLSETAKVAFGAQVYKFALSFIKI